MIERVSVGGLAELRRAYNGIYVRTEFGEKAALYRLVLRLLEAAEGEAVLDVGCGAGPFLEFAQGQGLRPVGLDLADQALLKARQKGATQLVLGQGERLPFADAAFRRLVCLGNLEHFLDPLAGARELARVLQPEEGRAVVMLPNAYYSGDIWTVVRTGRGPDHHQAIDRFATCLEWQDLLEAGGLEVLRVARWDKGKWWKWLFPFHLAYHFVYLVRRA